MSRRLWVWVCSNWASMPCKLCCISVTQMEHSHLHLMAQSWRPVPSYLGSHYPFPSMTKPSIYSVPNKSWRKPKWRMVRWLQWANTYHRLCNPEWLKGFETESTNPRMNKSRLKKKENVSRLRQNLNNNTMLHAPFKTSLKVVVRWWASHCCSGITEIHWRCYTVFLVCMRYRTAANTDFILVCTKYRPG